MCVTVVIVTYNGARWVERCFASLRDSAVALTTIVIDNGSTDDTVTQIATRFPEVEIIRSGSNLGFGLANNVGMARAHAAGAAHVFLLNQDAWIEPDTIRTLVAAQVGHPEYGVLSPMHLNGAGNALDYNFSVYLAPNHCRRLYSDMFLGTLAEVYDVPFVNAAAWLVSRDCIERVGGFSPSFFHYGEDYNYAQRMRFHGLRLGILPAVRICHDRAERGPGKFFSPTEIYRRDLVLKASDPAGNFSMRRECASLLKHLANEAAHFDRAECRRLLDRLRVIYDLDRPALLRNLEASRRVAPTFLREGGRPNR
jgi:N-acetylglucosaminyl-diphospho-decaprenol L-rhamnosyltransferase